MNEDDGITESKTIRTSPGETPFVLFGIDRFLGFSMGAWLVGRLRRGVIVAPVRASIFASIVGGAISAFVMEPACLVTEAHPLAIHVAPAFAASTFGVIAAQWRRSTVRKFEAVSQSSLSDSWFFPALHIGGLPTTEFQLSEY